MTHMLIGALIATLPFDCIMAWVYFETEGLDHDACIVIWLTLATIGALIGAFV